MDEDYFVNNKFLFTVTFLNKTIKIFQLIFRETGDFYVNYPYYHGHNGLIACASIKGDGNSKTKIDLKDYGKVTSHLVKYTRHADGRVHFSQDGKVHTSIKKHITPLKNTDGHDFSLYIQGILDFRNYNNVNTKYKVINFDFNNEIPEAIKFVGRIYSKDIIISKKRNGISGPKLSCKDSSGKISTGLIVTYPSNNIDDNKFILLTCQQIEKFSDNCSSLVFIGGFDKPEIINNLNCETTVLVANYPASNLDTLEKELGSIDLT